MDVLLAIAAGAIGSVITLGARGALLYFAGRREISVHDRRVRDIDDDLERWVVDDDVRLRRELRAERAALAARGALDSGEYGYRLGLAKERALHAFRDQRERVERELALIYDRESWAHERWRLRRRRLSRRGSPLHARRWHGTDHRLRLKKRLR